MHSTTSNLDSITAYLNFVTAVLMLLAALVGIASAVFKKLSKVEDRQRVVSSVFVMATYICPLGAFISLVGFNAERLSLALLVLGSVFISINYVRVTSAPGRVETLMLVLSWTFTASLLLLHQLSRITDLLGRLVGLRER